MLTLYIALRWASAAIKATLVVLGVATAVVLIAAGLGGYSVILAALVGIALAWDSEHASERAYAWVAARRMQRAWRRPVRRWM